MGVVDLRNDEMTWIKEGAGQRCTQCTHLLIFHSHDASTEHYSCHVGVCQCRISTLSLYLNVENFEQWKAAH